MTLLDCINKIIEVHTGNAVIRNVYEEEMCAADYKWTLENDFGYTEYPSDNYELDDDCKTIICFDNNGYIDRDCYLHVVQR